MAITGISVVEGGEGQHFIMLHLTEGNVQVLWAITNNVNAEHDVNELIRGLKTALGEIKQLASGIKVVRGIPDGLSRVPQGGKLNGPRSAS
jgi:hypothetical protein